MLESVTRRLLAVEVMEGDELRRIMGLVSVPPVPADDRIPLPITPGVN